LFGDVLKMELAIRAMLEASTENDNDAMPLEQQTFQENGRIIRYTK